LDNLTAFYKEIQSGGRYRNLNEAGIKQSIVLRLLSLLGWDPFNIDEIEPEYSLKNIRVDFVLKHNKSPRVFLFVRKDLNDSVIYLENLLDLSAKRNVGIAVLTDGLKWWFFLPKIKGVVEDKRFCTIEIDKLKLKDINKHFSDFLSRQNIISNNSVKIAEVICDTRRKMFLIHEHLPKAWQKIMSQPERWFTGIISEVTEDLCGYKPDREKVKEFIISEVRMGAGRSDSSRNEFFHRMRKKGESDYKGKSIVSFTLNGQSYKVDSWKDMLLKICGILASKHRDDFETVEYITLNGRSFFSKDRYEFLFGERISGTNFYVNMHMPDMYAVALSKELLVHFGYKASDLAIVAL
jgi:hypothetical protein